jgi:hypothetical protein
LYTNCTFFAILISPKMLAFTFLICQHYFCVWWSRVVFDGQVKLSLSLYDNLCVCNDFQKICDGAKFFLNCYQYKQFFICSSILSYPYIRINCKSLQQVFVIFQSQNTTDYSTRNKFEKNIHKNGLHKIVFHILRAFTLSGGHLWCKCCSTCEFNNKNKLF